MYTVQDIALAAQTNSTAIAIACILVWVVGFLQYFTAVSLQLKEKRSPWWFWQHAWYIGHDLTFVIFFNKWFKIIDFWTFKVMWAGCLVFVGIELFTLYRIIKDPGERQEVFGQWNGKNKEVTTGQAWARGLIGYALGFAIFITLTYAIGDPCCFFLTMSTNFIVAIFPALLARRRGSRQGHSMLLGIFILLGTINTFCPKINMWYNLAPVFQEPWYYVLGCIAILGCINYFYVLAKLPKKEALPNGKKPIW